MSSAPVLRIYGIHTEHLTQRATRFHGNIQQLRTAAIGLGYRVVPRLVLKPDVGKITDSLKEYGEKVSYEPTGDSEIDMQRQVFSTEMLSNFEKHREAWRHIMEIPDEQVGEKDLFLVIEDDSYLLGDGLEGWKFVLNTAHAEEWDMIHLGIAQTESKANYVILNRVSKVLPSKDAYLISRAAAKRLYNELTDKYRFILRVQLSHYANQHKDFRILCPNKRVLIDGSKLGIFPSSIHVNNLLAFNNEYVTLLKLFNSPRLDKEIKTARQIYKAIEHLCSPEGSFIMGKIEEKLGNPHEARRLYENSFAYMKANQGIINGRSELVTNLIKLYSKYQSDVEECSRLPSKYSQLI